MPTKARGAATKKANGTKATRKAVGANGDPTAALEGLLYQLLETELGGVQVYRTALRCAVNEDLKAEWTKYLEQTQRHVEVARSVLRAYGLDPDVDVPARMPVRSIGSTLVCAMEEALASGDAIAAQLTAAECVVQAETKDHQNWKLVGRLAAAATGARGASLQDAYDHVEHEEDHHLYHSTGWARELWLEALGLPATLPPPEEEQDVDSALEAARAAKDRDAQA